MNPNQEENRFKELFHDLKREDARLAPSFTRDWDAASSRVGKVSSFGPVARVIAALVVLLALGGLMRGSFRSSPKPTILTGTPVALSSISQWQSPTDFLLKFPGDSLLKTIPQLGESFLEIRGNISDQTN